MGRHPTAAYVTPITTAGAAVAEAAGESALGTSNRGVFTLAAATTYIFPLGGQDASVLHAMLQGDAAIIITSATVEESDIGESEAANHSDNAGEWIATSVDRITTSVEGTGWAATADVGSSAGGNAGAVAWNIVDHGARRTRIKVVVGATGGQVRMSAWAKE